MGVLIMKFVTLVEDTTKCELGAEHGLSIYAETEKHKLLFDVGTTDLFIKNAKALGIDLSQVDTVVISHGHNDHGGGLDAFLAINDHAVIYLQEKAFNDHYTAKKTGPEYIGLNQALKTHPQVKLLDGSYVIDDELQIYSHVTGEIYETNKNLLKEDKTRDDFVHEQHLLIQGRKNVLLMGCGHKGVLNIIRQCPAAPDIVIGGFHLYSPRTGECLPEPVIMDLAANLPDAVYYTGHCTGDKALKILTRELREIHPLMTGTVIEA